MKMVKEAWARWGIELWPAGGKSAWDRAIGGYPVDRPDLNPLDQSVHASWKTRRGGHYDRWRSRKESREHLVVFTTKLQILGHICLSILSAMQLMRNGILFEKRIGLKESEHHIYEIIILNETL